MFLKIDTFFLRDIFLNSNLNCHLMFKLFWIYYLTDVWEQAAGLDHGEEQPWPALKDGGRPHDSQVRQQDWCCHAHGKLKQKITIPTKI